MCGDLGTDHQHSPDTGESAGIGDSVLTDLSGLLGECVVLGAKAAAEALEVMSVEQDMHAVMIIQFRSGGVCDASILGRQERLNARRGMVARCQAKSL
eukprot:6462940-Amphidinium_carterae.2